jgi:hypothetical protein
VGEIFLLQADCSWRHWNFRRLSGPRVRWCLDLFAMGYSLAQAECLDLGCNTPVLRMHSAPANHEHKHCHAFINIA